MPAWLQSLPPPLSLPPFPFPFSSPPLSPWDVLVPLCTYGSQRKSSGVILSFHSHVGSGIGYRCPVPLPTEPSRRPWPEFSIFASSGGILSCGRVPSFLQLRSSRTPPWTMPLVLSGSTLCFIDIWKPKTKVRPELQKGPSCLAHKVGGYREGNFSMGMSNWEESY